jgi:excinuclease ABC subunit B
MVEGLDLPDVSLVAILDADKEGFLRSETALIQTMVRAARNLNGRVLMYAKTMTDSMKRAIDITKHRRERQMLYNKEHGITPKSVGRRLDENLKLEDHGILYGKKSKVERMPASERQKIVKELTKKMHEAAKKLEFEEAARLRDQINKIKQL